MCTALGSTALEVQIPLAPSAGCLCAVCKLPNCTWSSCGRKSGSGAEEPFGREFVGKEERQAGKNGFRSEAGVGSEWSLLPGKYPGEVIQEDKEEEGPPEQRNNMCRCTEA